jgi:ABC-type nitrate/sulfonate/bicarbonate transport system substrate-binding protein
MKARLAATALSAAVVLVACGSPPAAQNATGSSTAASAAGVGSANPGVSKPSLTKISVATAAVSPDASALFVAKEAGIFEQHGLDVNVQAIAGGSTTVSALLAGDIQIVTAGASEAIAAAAGGSDLVIVGVLSPVYSFLLEVPPSVKTPEDLKGKLLGVVALGATADIATRVGLRKLGLEPEKDVRITALGTQQAQTAAILNGTVDGGMMNYPLNLQAESKGFHSLLDMAQAKLPSAASSVYVQRPYATGHRDVVQGYIDSIVAGTARFKKDKPFAISVYKKYLKLDDEKALSATYDYFSKEVVPDFPYPRPENFADSIAVLAVKNPAVATFDINKAIDPSYVQSAADRHVG